MCIRWPWRGTGKGHSYMSNCLLVTSRQTQKNKWGKWYTEREEDLRMLDMSGLAPLPILLNIFFIQTTFIGHLLSSRHRDRIEFLPVGWL